LEAGLAEDRLLALRALHDEALFGTMTNFRYNTGRVLIQIMKEIIRAYGNYALQLHLAHDFRVTTSGNRRITRSMLKRYHLLEMPESWNQQAFDDHVHDAYTKGRKSPTHLIMDAWIKGLRSLKVVYFNYVNPSTVDELLRAAAIMKIQVRIGIEFKTGFNGRYVDIIWQLTRFADNNDLCALLNEEKCVELMQQGQAATLYYSNYIFALLENYNRKHRLDINKDMGISLGPISRNEFLQYVAAGQPAVLHLAEIIYDKAKPELEKLRREIVTAMKSNPAGTQGLRQQLNKILLFSPDAIAARWLCPSANPELPNPTLPPDTDDPDDAPEILRYSTKNMVEKLSALLPSSRITLSLRGLEVCDVLEILHDCEGKITHLELLNLKYFDQQDTKLIENINNLQNSINDGRSIALKKQIFSILADCPDSKADKLKHILRNIPKLQNYYRENKLKTSIGSSSTSRSGRKQGMGFVWIDTLPWLARRAIKKDLSSRRTTQPPVRSRLPIYAEINSRITIKPVSHLQNSSFWNDIANKLLLLRRRTSYREQSWIVYPERIFYCAEGNLSTLGGMLGDQVYTGSKKEDKHTQNNLWKTLGQADDTKLIGPRHSYINTKLLNILKVLIGFIAAMLTFMYTQSWWPLAFFGAPIWFGITGFRNILQAVLGAGGLRRSPLLRWNNFVSRTRLCDSLFYTGFSVPLLELVMNYWFLNSVLSITPSSHPWLFFAAMSLVNGCYIATHNIFRGFPASVAIGNIFRSFFAVPVSIIYSLIFTNMFALFLPADTINLLLLKCSSIVSKLASDTIAGIIEGFAERSLNMHIRIGDYKAKIHKMLESFTRLEILLPEDNFVLKALSVPKDSCPVLEMPQDPVREQERAITIDSLDFLYFWMYQPRARSALQYLLRTMSKEERHIFCRAQFVLTREKEVLTLFTEGILGNSFLKAQTFYLAEYRNYLKEIMRLADVNKTLPGE
ncbi:MAG: hypothetical protein LBV76_00945, partial [Deltaproteobacteria bacterium]|nr:hypothetical protein [Deltaproteobacteria bacterium]